MQHDQQNTVFQTAKLHGFEVMSAAPIGETPHFDAFEEWLNNGLHADLEWMRRSTDVRKEPKIRLDSAISALVLATHHHPGQDQSKESGKGRVARYAWGRDYHNQVGKRLRKLRKELRNQGIESWGGVDTAPIIERSWAEQSGLGFTGKNCMTIIPASGSWFTLAVLFVSTALPSFAQRADHCGECRRCLDACPTGALVSDRVLDTTKCISYWTIESKGLPPEELRPLFGDRVFGCDICQEVCPHNASPIQGFHSDFDGPNQHLDLAHIIESDDDALMAEFIGTPLRRSRAAGLKRNAIIALANEADSSPDTDRLLDLAEAHHDPMVKEITRWAKATLTARRRSTK